MSYKDESIYRQKTIRILQEIENGRYMTEIQQNTLFTYAHIITVVSILEKKGLVAKSKDGRIVRINLTENGKLVMKHFKAISKLAGETL